VQETFLCARRGFSEFRGNSESELLSWLRTILAAQLANTWRHYTSRKRNVRVERRFCEQLDRSSHVFGQQFASRLESPSEALSRRERAVLLADALDQLNRTQREVIIMRHMESKSFPEIAVRMDRTLDSVKSLWTRAIHNLRQILREIE
jgi:RNA polymerase sigma-70 factor (ECF subfamily)